MIAEFDVFGAYVPALLVWIGAALVVSAPVRWALRLTGAYRLIWHPALFDLALLAILTAVAAAVGGALR